MKLEGSGGTALGDEQRSPEDPFRTASGYHRIALDVMNALTGVKPGRIVVNTTNAGALEEIDAKDIVEVSSMISESGIVPERGGKLPEAVRGLVLAVKAYERVAIQAAIEDSPALARKAMLLYPAIGEWEPSKALLESLIIHC